MTPFVRSISWTLIAALAASGPACAVDSPAVTIRTEAYARPPYSEATYYVYERNGKVICTKLAVCNKYDECDADYHAGAYVDPQDQKAGKPAHVTDAVLIPPGRRARHQCLTRLVPDAL